MNIQELKAVAPERFDEEYQHYCTYACDHDWFEWINEDYKAQLLAEFGVHIIDIEFNGFYCQGDYAKWSARIPNPKQFMRATGLMEKHLAFTALVDDTDDYGITVGHAYNYSPSIMIDDFGTGYYSDQLLSGTLFAGMSFTEVEHMVAYDDLETDIY